MFELSGRLAFMPMAMTMLSRHLKTENFKLFEHRFIGEAFE
ncbi:hypothetical protein [uncultured Desulfosarcina sp.]|nr:hypothetical protein [uncultured Desulfosarcina sp.]